MEKLTNIQVGGAILVLFIIAALPLSHYSAFSSDTVKWLYVVALIFAVWETAYAPGGLAARVLRSSILGVLVSIAVAGVCAVATYFTKHPSQEDVPQVAFVVVLLYVGLPVIFGSALLSVLPIRPPFSSIGQMGA